MGSWLLVNGDAIYGLVPEDFRRGRPSRGRFVNDTNTAVHTTISLFTTSSDVFFYAIELGWPTKPEAVIHSIGTGAVGERTIESVELLAWWKVSFRPPDGLHIQLPERIPRMPRFGSICGE